MTKKTKPAVKGVATPGKAAELKVRLRHAVERADTARAVAKAAKDALKHAKKRAKHTRKEAKNLRKTAKELQRQLKELSAVWRPTAKRRAKAKGAVKTSRPKARTPASAPVRELAPDLTPPTQEIPSNPPAPSDGPDSVGT